MSQFQLKYKPFNERSILIEWPSEIDKNTLKNVLFLKSLIEKNNSKLILEVKSAYSSLLIIYNSTIDNINDEILVLKKLYLSKNNVIKDTFKLWKIPVCYEAEFALDLEEICSKKNLSKQQIIKLHSETIYTVFFIGFLPGFLYLGGLNKMLFFSRKSTPRLQVKKGAVAIGGNQTGVYPNESPGGWNVIGNSPISFFDIKKDVPCFAKPGDKIQFVPVTMDAYNNIKSLVEADTYQLESEVFDG